MERFDNAFAFCVAVFSVLIVPLVAMLSHWGVWS